MTEIEKAPETELKVRTRLEAFKAMGEEERK